MNFYEYLKDKNYKQSTTKIDNDGWRKLRDKHFNFKVFSFFWGGASVGALMAASSMMGKADIISLQSLISLILAAAFFGQAALYFKINENFLKKIKKGDVFNQIETDILNELYENPDMVKGFIQEMITDKDLPEKFREPKTYGGSIDWLHADKPNRLERERESFTHYMKELIEAYFYEVHFTNKRKKVVEDFLGKKIDSIKSYKGVANSNNLIDNLIEELDKDNHEIETEINSNKNSLAGANKLSEADKAPQMLQTGINNFSAAKYLYHK